MTASLRESILKEVRAENAEKIRGQLVKTEEAQAEAVRTIAEGKALKAEAEAAIKAANDRAQAEINAAKAHLQLEVDQKVALQTAAAVAAKMPELLNAATEQAQALAQPEMARLQQSLAHRDKEMAELQEARAQEVAERRAFEDEKRKFELDREEAISKAQAEARLEAREAVADEREQERQQHKIQLQRAQDQVAELNRRLETKPSQELQGEAFEERFQAELEVNFRQDSVEPVKKGQHGGDLLLHINLQLGKTEATIHFECKKAANWSSAWLQKARDDARSAGAEVAVIVTHALPKEITAFGQMDGVWVCSPQYAVALANVLRGQLLELVRARIVAKGRGTQAELLWDYITGPAFRGQVMEGMEAFKQLRKVLEDDQRQAKQRWTRMGVALNKLEGSVFGIADSVSALGADDAGAFEAEDHLALPESDTGDAY